MWPCRLCAARAWLSMVGIYCFAVLSLLSKFRCHAWWFVRARPALCQFAFDFWRPVLCDLSFSFLFVFSVLINFSLFQSRRFYAADQTTDKTGGIMFSNCSSMCGACVHRWRHSLTGLPSTSTLFKLFYNWGAVRISTIIFAGILTEKYFLI